MSDLLEELGGRGEEELAGVTAAQTARTEKAAPTPRTGKVKLWHPDGFAVTVAGAGRVAEFRRRGYTDAAPKKKGKAT